VPMSGLSRVIVISLPPDQHHDQDDDEDKHDGSKSDVHD
jgi:hypothetical protein